MADGTIVLFLLVLGAFVYWIEVLKRERTLSLPPGPKPLPFIGNLFDLPKEKPWITFRNWSQKYDSDILFVNLPRQPTIILNSFQAAIDLMEKRSKLYSDRVPEVMDELTGWSWNLAFQPYGQRWRDTRRCFHQYFNQAAVKQYHLVQTREVRRFLGRGLTFEEEIDVKSVSLTFASIILEITYGIPIYTLEDELALLSQNAVVTFVASKVPGAFWVEFFPWLKHIPAWVPGAKARQVGEHYRPIVEATRSLPFDAVEKAVDAGIAVPSVAQKLIQKLRAEFGTETSADYRDKERASKDAAGVAYAAAVDTQTSASCWFFVALSLAPDVQRKAQAELDAVLGSRLPTMADMAELPYVQAIVLEVMRWSPMLPLGVNHRLLVGEDDEYAGYCLPGGSVVIPNAWAMLHNPVDYPDPDRFNPDRFMRDGRLNPNVRDPMLAAFGFGRRICPGRYLAADTLTLLFASVLAVFNIESTMPKYERTPPKPTTGLISYPESVPCRLKIRHAAAMTLINADPESIPLVFDNLKT